MERETVCLLEMPEWGGDLPSINFVTPKSPDLNPGTISRFLMNPRHQRHQTLVMHCPFVSGCTMEDKGEKERRDMYSYIKFNIGFWKGSLGAFHALGWHQRHTAGIPISLK